MANVDSMTWTDLVKTYKLHDNGLLKAQGEFTELRSKEEYDGVLAKLTTMQKLATDLKNSKEAKAAGPDVIKRMSKLIEGFPESRRKYESLRAEEAKAGTRTSVTITLEGWDGKSMQGVVAVKITPAKDGRTVEKKLSIPGTTLKIEDIYLQPHGTLELKLLGGTGGGIYCQGTTPYDFKPGQPFLRFHFKQDKETIPVMARNSQEVSKKVSKEGGGHFEINFKDVIKVGGDGKVATESEAKEGFEFEAKWDVKVGADRFEKHKQI